MEVYMNAELINPIDVLFSFDTTGSMYPCLTQVRRKVEKTVKKLYGDIPDLRIAVIAHGDYIDDNNPYVIKILDFTSDEETISSFVRHVEPTYGGDTPEAYELVLHEARSLSWRSGKAKVLVMIGDDIPHKPNYRLNTKNLDWENELGLLLEAGIHVYGVHCMPGIRKHSKKFYQKIAKKTDGLYLTLDQFSSITDIVMSICYKQMGDDKLKEFANEVTGRGDMNRNLADVINTLSGEKTAEYEFKSTPSELIPVPPGRFQVLEVEEDQKIKDFVHDQGVDFVTGRGFYQLKKTVLVQGSKEIVMQHKETGDIFTGPQVRNMLKLPPQSGEAHKKSDDRIDVRLKPMEFDDYYVFIQSTSHNRKLLAGTKLLYEVKDQEEE